MKSCQKNAYFYVSLAGSLMFLGRRFEATWSVTHSLWHQMGLRGAGCGILGKRWE